MDSPVVSDRIRSVLDQMEASTRAVDEARTLPPECYTSKEFLEFEKEAIYRRCWLYVGHESQIPEAGNYLADNILGEPVVVVRTRDGGIKAMSAVCRHRSRPLVVENGSAKLFRCPYHNWTYDLNGNLMGAPEMNKTCPLKELRQGNALPAIRFENWNGFLFINFDEDAEPLAPSLQKLQPHIENFVKADLKVGPVIHDYGEIPGNWKIWVENAMEPYHTPWVHPMEHDYLAPKNSRYEDHVPSDASIHHWTYITGWFEEDEKPQYDLQGPDDAHMLFPPIKTLTEEELNRAMFATIPPFLFFSAMPDMVFIFQIVPITPDSINLKVSWLFAKECLEMPDIEERARKQDEFNDIFNQQDFTTNKHVQQGLHSKYAPRGRYCYLEETLPQINRWLLKRCRDYVEQCG